MHYREFAPGEDASRIVDCYWVLEGAAPGAVQRVVPDGRPELILNLGQPFESLQNGQWQPQPQCFLAGQLTGPLLLRATGATREFWESASGRAAPANCSACRCRNSPDRVVPAGDLGLQSLARTVHLARHRTRASRTGAGRRGRTGRRGGTPAGALAGCRRRRGAARRQPAPTGAALQGASRNVAQTLRAHPPLSARLPRHGRRRRDGWMPRPPADTTTRPT